MQLKKVLGCLSTLAVIVALANVWLWLKGHDELAIAMIVFVTALVSFVAASAWAALLLRAGAQIAVQSQESDDKRDIAQAKVAIELIKAMRQMQGQYPALPEPRTWESPTVYQQLGGSSQIDL